MAMISLSLPKHWEDWIGGALGLWLLASPNVIPYGEPAATQNAFLVGVLLIAIAVVEMRPSAPGRNGSTSSSARGLWFHLGFWAPP